MGLACSLGSHSWSGCRCAKCGKTRAEGHNWASDCEKCSTCGTVREVAHAWGGCRCTRCKRTRDEEHDWSKDCEKCARCGRTRKDGHAYRGCRCTACGKVRDLEHAWEGAICSICSTHKSDAQEWADSLPQASKFLELSRLVGEYSHELNERDKKRRETARLMLLAVGEEAVDAVIEAYGPCRDYWSLAEVLMSSYCDRAALPLLSRFPTMSASSDTGKVVKYVARTKTPEVARRLEELLREDSSGTRRYAAEALGRLEMDETAGVLLAALNGDPHVRSGLESASTSFAWSVLKTFEEQRKSAGPDTTKMSEADMLKIMQAFAAAYLADDNRTRDRLEDTVKDIGRELHRRGGEAKMREMLQHFNGPASRHIERVWSGIGGWLG